MVHNFLKLKLFYLENMSDKRDIPLSDQEIIEYLHNMHRWVHNVTNDPGKVPFTIKN